MVAFRGRRQCNFVPANVGHCPEMEKHGCRRKYSRMTTRETFTLRVLRVHLSERRHDAMLEHRDRVILVGASSRTTYR